jgi:hypothetical protein
MSIPYKEWDNTNANHPEAIKLKCIYTVSPQALAKVFQHHANTSAVTNWMSQIVLLNTHTLKILNNKLFLNLSTTRLQQWPGTKCQTSWWQ